MGRGEAPGATKAVEAYAKYAPLGYTLGDEIYLNGFEKSGRFSDSAVVMAGFRKYLAEKYEDIDSLNQEWGRQCGGFEQVSFGSENELLADKGNPAPWYDYRMFLSDYYVRLFYDYAEVIRSRDQGAKVGYDGCEQYSSYDGYDLGLGRSLLE